MECAQLQFHPEVMDEQAGRLAGLAARAGRALEGIAAVPAALRGQLGGEDALSLALAETLERGVETARRLAGLAAGLEQAAAIYARAERTVDEQVQALPGTLWGGGQGRAGAPMGAPAGALPDGPAQFGDLLLDPWLIQLTLEDQAGLGEGGGSAWRAPGP